MTSSAVDQSCGARLVLTVPAYSHYDLTCAMPHGHSGYHCTENDSEWATTTPPGDDARNES